jgi:serine/threonine protein kinase
MTPNVRWLRIKELFAQYHQQPDDRREAWLGAQCAGDGALLEDVRGLLSAQQAEPGILGDNAVGVLKNMRNDEQAVDLVGRHIGLYRLLSLIGEGGMGSVYLAEREEGDFRQRVALKLIRADFLDDEARTRFQRERRILAQLTHPHIAQLHDGGVAASGTPYFTLEYVEGEPITKYCDGRRLTIRDRLRLVLQVCAAVAYAHRNLIVHRDLKPSNIFVTTDGQVKLLDFGIAKLLDADTAENQTVTQARMMTPEYAAPEQVLGEPITTATDVYSIGVLLYELLSGRLPYARADAGTISWSKAVVEETPEPVYRALNRTTTRGATTTGDAVAAARGTALPALRRSLRGDLERILQRALAKTPEARYTMVGALAADVNAYLEGQSISGGTRTYQLRKFVRRHWLPLAAAAAILMILLVSGAAIVWQSRQTAREAQNTLQVKDFLFGLFTAVDPREAKGREVSAHELLDRGAERIGRNRNLDQVQKAEIGSTLGRIYFQLGLFDQANKLQEEAIKVLFAAQTQPLLLVQTEAERAATLDELGDLKSAAALADDAGSRIDALPNAPIVERAYVLHVQAYHAMKQRDFAAGKRYADAQLAVVRNSDVDPSILVRALRMSGGASWGLSNYDDAESYDREALAVALRDAGPDDLDVASTRAGLGMVLHAQSRFAEARQLKQQALATDEKVLGPEHPITMAVRRDLGLSYFHLGLYPQARAALEQTLAAQRRIFGNENLAVAGTEINLGVVLTDSGDLSEADRILTEALNILQKKFGRDHAETQMVVGNLGVLHTLQGDLEHAEKELTEVLDVERKLSPAGLDVGDLYHLGEIKRLRGDAAAAIELERSALAISQKKYGEGTRYTAMAHHMLALALRDQGDTAGAERELRAALTSYAGYIPQAEHPLAATSRYELGLLLIQRETDRTEGIRLLTEATSLREKFLGADEPRTKQAREALLKAQASAKFSSPQNSATSG